MKKRILLSWSSGKDSAWALHALQQDPDWEIAGLLTTFNEAVDRVAMHAVRRTLVEAQAAAAGLPLVRIPIPSPCPNEVYEARMGEAVRQARAAGITHMAFGDLFLEDVRRYREDKLAGTGIEPVFPIWGIPTDVLARDMISAGLVAQITCVDPRQIAAGFAGRTWNADLISDLPASADPCGERGEFHTFCYAGPMFQHPIAVAAGEVLERDGFVFADCVPV
jgi:uncharacterized protein (TIGR00290 family)